MRYFTLLLILFLSTASYAESVQWSKSTYYEQHVSVDDRGDHYVFHFNVFVRLDKKPDETRLLHASVFVSRGPSVSDVSELKRSVRLSKKEERWSFFFRVPKFAEDAVPTKYAVLAKVDGIQKEASAIWKFDGGKPNLGSPAEPVNFIRPVGRAVQEPDGVGGFRIVVRYEVMVYMNDYDELPICGLLKANKQMPSSIDGIRSAKRL